MRISVTTCRPLQYLGLNEKTPSIDHQCSSDIPYGVLTGIVVPSEADHVHLQIQVASLHYSLNFIHHYRPVHRKHSAPLVFPFICSNDQVDLPDHFGLACFLA